MAKAKRKSTKRRPCPPCTEGAVARSAFSTAIKQHRCDIADRALDKIKSDLSARADHMTANGRRLAFRDVLSKQAKVNSCREARESSDANRFNGLGFFGSMPKRRRRRRR